MKNNTCFFNRLFVFLFCFLVTFFLIGETRGIKSGHRYDRLIIKNVIVIDGKGTPPRGPMDIVIKQNRIVSIKSSKGGANVYKGEKHVLDGRGLYLLPGLINIHAHIHDNRGGKPIPFEYIYKLWMSCGITSVRDVGSNYKKTIEERSKSEKGLIVAPRIFLYMVAWSTSPDDIRKKVREQKNWACGLPIMWVLRRPMYGMMRHLVQPPLNTGTVCQMRPFTGRKIFHPGTITAMKMTGFVMRDVCGGKRILRS